ncbi:hypothetical protein N602_29360 [Mycobacterium avium subsp. hominissuis 10-5606]|nr:hypothetical protein N602_29360 [Mycobacterium avium subsp. hominissuis 10-5606]
MDDEVWSVFLGADKATELRGASFGALIVDIGKYTRGIYTDAVDEHKESVDVGY